LESRAPILEQSRDELRGRAERAEREPDRLRHGTGDGQPAPTLPARRRDRPMYWELGGLRQAMNQVEHVEPAGAERFPS
jgi:hypothetical protein